MTIQLLSHNKDKATLTEGLKNEPHRVLFEDVGPFDDSQFAATNILEGESFPIFLPERKPFAIITRKGGIFLVE